MDTILAIAPLVSWIRVLLAALLILFGMVAYGHAHVAGKGYGADFRGWLSPDPVARWRRRSLILNAAGLALWAAELAWSPLLTGAFVLIALVGLGMAAFTRVHT